MMREFFPRMTGVALIGVLLSLTGSRAWSSENAAQLKPVRAPSESDKFFEREVQPLLKANCFACQGGGQKVEAGLRLTSRETILKGGGSGPAGRLGHPEQRLLSQAEHCQ